MIKRPTAKKILVIRYRFIGDTILTVPFLRNLRRSYPDAQIDVLVGPQSGEVLEGCPHVNNLVVYDTTRFHKYDSGAGKRKSFWSYVFSLRKENYDTAFVLKRSWSSALLALLIGARTRVGYATEGRQFLLTHHVPHLTDMHEVDSTLTLLECAGIEIKDRFLESFVSTTEQAQIEDLPEWQQLANTSKKVLIHAPAAHPDKLYPLESWAEIVRILAQEHGYLPVFTGAKQDIELYDRLQDLAGTRGINLAGRLSLRQSIALYTNLDLAICTDSGPAHLAAAAGIPTVALFGPTDPVRWRPFAAIKSAKQLAMRSGRQQSSRACGATTDGAASKEATEAVATAEKNDIAENEAVYIADLPCRPCNYNKTCTDRPCLKDLSAATVVARALALYRRWQE
jgi:heptosyltransferase-2